MRSHSSSPRIGATVSLAGIALNILGLFLPMFIESQPMGAGGARPVYEWSFFTPFLGVAGWLFFTLPWLGLLIVLVTSSAALLRAPLPIPAWVRRVAATGGLVLQSLLQFFVLALTSMGLAHTETGWGFVVLPFGFLVMTVGAFVGSTHQRQRVFFDPPTE